MMHISLILGEACLICSLSTINADNVCVCVCVYTRTFVCLWLLLHEAYTMNDNMFQYF